MLQIDPTRALQRIWHMSWWGSVLVVFVFVTTAVFLFFLVVYPNTNGRILFGGIAILLWLSLLICYYGGMANLKRKLDDLILKGERVKSRIVIKSDEDIDRCERLVQAWDEDSYQILKGTEWERSYKSITGLTKLESETSGDFAANTISVYKNYMTLRLMKLKEIRDRL